MEYKHSKEEIAKVKKAMDYILDDMRAFYNASNCDELKIRLNDGHDKFYDSLEIKSHSIYFNAYSLSTPYTSGNRRFCLERKIGKVVRCPEYHHAMLIYIISNYDDIRKKIENRVKNILESNNRDFLVVDELLNRFNKEASIEINLPSSKNPHQLEIIEEEGQKVGIINFGDRTIKIITNGDIVLVNKKDKLDKPQVKHK